MAEPRAIDRIRQKFTSALRPLVIPELGETYYFGPLVAADMDAVRKSVEGKDVDEATLNLNLLVEKAMDAAGHPLFQAGDIEHLKRNLDWAVLQRIIGFMYQSTLTPMEAVKAVEASDPNPSGSASSST
ncbi:MAG TPA: hypothetical protein VGI83_06885 [Gemmatimonadales bacterium]|jgi:hypothetical protein